MDQPPQEKFWHTSVDSSGRVLVPSELRRDIGAGPGTPVVWQKQGDSLVLKSFDDVIKQVQNYYRSIDPGAVWTDELKKMRTEEASIEIRRT